MRIIVQPHSIKIIKEEEINENEYNINKCFFEFSNEYTDELVKIALFTIKDKCYKQIIINNECNIPSEILKEKGFCLLGVYAYQEENKELLIRYSPSPQKFVVEDGSYKDFAENSQPVTPSELEQYQQALQNGLNELQNVLNDFNQKLEQGYFKGESATINGYNTIEIIPGKNISIAQTDNKLKINNIYEYDDSAIIQTIYNNTTNIDKNKTDIKDLSDNMINYSLKTQTGSIIDLNINKDTFTLKALLKNVNNEIISQSQEIDLPIEQMIVNANYNDNTKELVLTLQNGNITKIPISSLTDGLVNESDLNIKLKPYAKTEYVDKQVSNNIDIIDIITPKQVVSGNNVEIDDALALPIFQAKINGNSFQQKSNGYQLFDYSKIPTFTQHGATVTNNGDGSFTINGEGTLSAYYSNIYSLSHEESIKLLKPGNIYLLIDELVSIYPYMSFRSQDEPYNEVNGGSLNNQVRTITQKMLDDPTFYIRIGFFGSTGAEIPNTTVKFIVYQDGDGTWEPFTGGQPSPNIDYPQEITSVRKATLNIEQDENVNKYPMVFKDYYISKLGEFKDTLVIDKSKKTRLLKIIQENVFDGTESWFKSGLTNSSTFVLTLDVSNLNINKNARVYTLCTHFRYDNQNIKNDVFRIYDGTTDVSYIALCFDINEINSLEQAIDWIKTNKPKIQYVSNQIENIELEKMLNQIVTFEGVNNIFLESNLDTTFEIKYAQDIKKYIDKQNNLQNNVINEINTLLSTTETSSMLLDNYQSDLESEV